MHRIDSSTAKANQNGSGKNGFTGGIPGVEAATVIGPDWFNAVQEEIANAVEGLGLTLDKPNRAQLLEAITKRGQASAQYVMSGTKNLGARFALSEIYNDNSAYTLASDQITVPRIGLYLITFHSEVKTSSSSNPSGVSVALRLGGTTTLAQIVGNRFSASNSDSIWLAASTLCYVDDVSKKIDVVSGATTTTIAGSASYLNVVALHA